jgi:hypothetical protein
LSGFFAKVSIKALTLFVMNVEGWEEEIIDNVELGSLRHFARYSPGKTKF